MIFKRKAIIASIYIFFTNTMLFCIEIPFSNKEIRIDENHLSQFVRISPPDSLLYPLSTDVWLWHDGKNLYLQWKAEIDKNFNQGKYTSYDKWPEADYLRLQLITDIKSYYAYGYYAFPLGNKYDFIRNSSLSTDRNWNSTYEYTSEINDYLWSVLMVIPFKDLRFSGSPPYNWKIILSRSCYEKNETYSVPFLTTKMGKDYFRDAEDIIIKEKIKKSRNLFIRPYTIFIMDLGKKETEFDKDNIGLDFSFNPNFSTKLKLSYNPDFSDVPMDNEKDIYNSKYAPTFEENRYFFIEDFNALGINNELFYSRYIVQPVYALKVTSNSENYSYGLLSSLDKKTKNANDDLFNILAFKPTSKTFSFQFTLLNRMNDDYHNEVLHLKPVWEFSKNKSLWVDMNLSTKEVDNDSQNGYYGNAGYSLIQKDFNLSISARQMSKNYTIDMGKIYEDDYYGWNINSYLSKDVNNQIIRELKSNLALSEEIDNDTNDLLERYASISLEIYSQFNLNITFNFAYVKELYNQKYFDKQRTGLQISWNKIDWLNAFVGINKTRYIIYKLQNIYDGYYNQFGVSGVISKSLAYRVYAENILSFDIPSPDEVDGTEVDDNYWIGNLDLNFNLTNSLSLTNGLRYNNYEVYKYSEYTGFFSNFRWEFKKGCDLYIGYKSTINEIDNKHKIDYNQAYIKVSYTF